MMKLTAGPSLIDEMRNERNSSSAAFIKFTDNYKRFDSHAFCFYEGEDGKYYNQRIKQLIGNKIIPIVAKNKEGTLRIWRKISKDSEYSTVKTMFFVDRDVDSPPADIDNNLYITPCYSVENLYCNNMVLKNVLEAEFSINCTEQDFIKCCDLFDILFDKFCIEMIPFNALVLIRNRKNLNNGKVSLKIKTRQVISITLEEVKKGNKYHELYILKESLNVSDEEYHNTVEHISEIGDYPNNFRGKNQLDFMIEFLNLLKTKKDDLNFFEVKRECISLNLTKNRLSELSQYAITPECLTDFILKHKVIL